MSTILLTELNVYPVKSCRGISLTTAELDARGIRHDRRWMVVDQNYRFVTQREYPRLALISIALQVDHLHITAPGISDFHVPFLLKNGVAVRVVVWNDTVSSLDVGEEAAAWFSEFLGSPLRLVYMPDDADRIASRRGYRSPVGFADGYPLLVLSEASLEDLNRRLDEPLPMNRFRPNIVVRGCEPHAEDAWNEIMIGDVTFHVVKPCERCAIPTVNQSTGEKWKEPLRTLATYRMWDGKVLFGQNLIHEGIGLLRVGDVVKIMENSK